jgi:hypothetical protein
MRDGTQASRGCIRQNFWDFDGVGRSIKCQSLVPIVDEERKERKIVS